MPARNVPDLRIWHKSGVGLLRTAIIYFISGSCIDPVLSSATSISRVFLSNGCGCRLSGLITRLHVLRFILQNSLYYQLNGHSFESKLRIEKLTATTELSSKYFPCPYYSIEVRLSNFYYNIKLIIAVNRTKEK